MQLIFKIFSWRLQVGVAHSKMSSQPITRLNTTEWETSILNGTDSWIIEEQKLKALEYKYFNAHPGWSLIGVKVATDSLSDVVAKADYSTVTVSLAFRRNHQFYTLTLIVPIVVLTLLTPLGLIMPGTLVNESKSMTCFSCIRRNNGLSSHTFVDSCCLR